MRHAAFDPLPDSITPASGAVVMGTGIVSVALSLDGHELLSRILLVVAGTAWVVLAGLAGARAARDPARFRRGAGTPAALTAVAGTAVLGTRLTLLGWAWAGAALLVLALALWLGLVWRVLGEWRTPTVGTSFVLAVGTESLALLAAAVATRQRLGWLLVAALVPFVLGVAFYAFVARSFDPRQLAVGQGDHWLTGGALAISTLAAAEITMGADRLGTLGALAGALQDVAVGLWVLTILWLPVLLVVEARWPRTRYGERRWSTVFPVGMYAACSFAVGTVASAPVIADFARVWVWVALAVWAVVAGGLARSVAGLAAA